MFFLHVFSANSFLFFKTFFYCVIMTPSYVVRHWFLISYLFFILCGSWNNHCTKIEAILNGKAWLIFTVYKAYLKISKTFHFHLFTFSLFTLLLTFDISWTRCYLKNISFSSGRTKLWFTILPVSVSERGIISLQISMDLWSCGKIIVVRPVFPDR